MAGGTLSRIRAQLIVGVMLMLGAVLQEFGVIPSSPAIMNTLRQFLDTYGVGFVVLIAFLEHIGGLNVYFPGSIAILVAMANTSGNPRQAWAVFSAIILASALAQVVNFVASGWIGKKFFRADEGYVEDVGDSWYFWYAYWHPHFAAWASIKAADDGLSLRQFVSRASAPFLVWNGFWGLSLYAAGEVVFVRVTESPGWIIVIYLLWLIWGLASVPQKLTALKVRLGFAKKDGLGDGEIAGSERLESPSSEDK